MESGHFSQNDGCRLSLCGSAGMKFTLTSVPVADLILLENSWWWEKDGWGFLLVQKKYAHSWINDWRGPTVIGSHWGERMGKWVQLQALQKPETTAWQEGRTWRQLLPLLSRILFGERKGCQIMLNSCCSKGLAWQHVSFTNQLTRCTLSPWSVGTLVSHWNPDSSESPGAYPRVTAWPAVLHVIVRRGFLLSSGDTKWHE